MDTVNKAIWCRMILWRLLKWFLKHSAKPIAQTSIMTQDGVLLQIFKTGTVACGSVLIMAIKTDDFHRLGAR